MPNFEQGKLSLKICWCRWLIKCLPRNSLLINIAGRFLVSNAFVKDLLRSRCIIIGVYNTCIRMFVFRRENF